MKKILFFAVALGATFALSSCKSRESAYRQAYLNALNNQTETTTENTVTVPVNDDDSDVSITPVTTTTTPTVVKVETPVKQEQVDMSEVRTISDGMQVVSGNPLKTFSVIVGSFTQQANAEGLQSQLKNAGYDARVIRTEETINGIKGWYRVAASSYDSKASALQSRNELRNKYNGAWLLYSK